MTLRGEYLLTKSYTLQLMGLVSKTNLEKEDSEAFILGKRPMVFR